MQNNVKSITIAYIAAAVLVPMAFNWIAENFLGFWLMPLPKLIEYVVSIGVFGYLAHRSHNSDKLPLAASRAAVTTAPPHTPSRLGFGIVGAVLGFGVGYLTRPTFLGEPIPLQVMFEPIPRELASIKTNFISHMGIATAIGVVASVVLVQILISVRKA